MGAEDIILVPLDAGNREEFIAMNQAAFQVAVDKEFGKDAGTAIPREDIEQSLDSPTAQSFMVMLGRKMVGGAVCQINPKSIKGSLDLLFVDPVYSGRGIGYETWKRIEAMFPEVRVWETHTPYFDTRNIHFYVNKCGFSIVEFYCPANPMENTGERFPGDELFFRFEKRMF